MSVLTPYAPSVISKRSPALITTYAMNGSEMENFQDWLITDDFIDAITVLMEKPIDNILSCRVYPFDIPAAMNNTSSAVTIKVNTCRMESSGSLPNVTGVNVSEDQVPPLLSFGTILCSAFQNDSFLDYSPYTKITLYLPFLGFIEIDPTDILGGGVRDIKLQYAFDLYTGDCTAYVSGGRSNTIFASKSGKLGFEIPLTGGREAKQVVGTASTLLTAATSIAASVVTKNPIPAVLGTIGSVSSGIMGAVGARADRAGQLSNTTALYAPQYAYFLIERQQSALPADPSIFNATVGRACCKTGTLSSFHGFTKCSAFHLDGFLNALDSELEEIDSLLRSGIILPASE